MPGHHLLWQALSLQLYITFTVITQLVYWLRERPPVTRRFLGTGVLHRIMSLSVTSFAGPGQPVGWERTQSIHFYTWRSGLTRHREPTGHPYLTIICEVT